MNKIKEVDKLIQKLNNLFGGSCVIEIFTDSKGLREFNISMKDFLIENGQLDREDIDTNSFSTLRTRTGDYLTVKDKAEVVKDFMKNINKPIDAALQV